MVPANGQKNELGSKSCFNRKISIGEIRREREKRLLSACSSGSPNAYRPESAQLTKQMLRCVSARATGEKKPFSPPKAFGRPPAGHHFGASRRRYGGQKAEHCVPNPQPYRNATSAKLLSLREWSRSRSWDFSFSSALRPISRCWPTR